MIKNFIHFEEISFLGLEHFRDPATVLTNILLFIVGFVCFLRLSKFKNNSTASITRQARGWRLFFLFSSFAFLLGVPIHGFSWYIPEQTHFYVWLLMGWIQNLALVFAQFATLQHYFPKQEKWIRPLILVQFVFFCWLMFFIRRFGAVNVDAALALLPIAIWNFFLHSKNKLASGLVGWGVFCASLGGVVVVFKLMPSPWFTYNDIGHLILVVSLVLMYKGLVKNFISFSAA